MSERAWAGIAFGATLGIVIGLRLNAQGMLLIATVLMAALLLCPLVAWRLVAANLWPTEEELWVRIERVPTAPPRPTRAAAPALPARSLPARRGAAPRRHRPAEGRRVLRRGALIDATNR